MDILNSIRSLFDLLILMDRGQRISCISSQMVLIFISISLGTDTLIGNISMSFHHWIIPLLSKLSIYLAQVLPVSFGPQNFLETLVFQCNMSISMPTKPHLLIKWANNFGTETKIHYTPSTKFYLADQQAGNPWLTRLPFPVQCVDRVEVFDYISHHRYGNRYAYHSGFYDGLEREFRGFAMVEQWDTDIFEIDCFSRKRSQ